MERSKWSEEELVEQAKKFCHEVDFASGKIYVLTNLQDCRKAQNSYAINRLKQKYKYQIKMI